MCNPAKRLNNALDRTIGRVTYGDGTKVFGHRRKLNDRRNIVTAMLKQEIGEDREADPKSALETPLECASSPSIFSPAGWIGLGGSIALATVIITAAL